VLCFVPENAGHIPARRRVTAGSARPALSADRFKNQQEQWTRLRRAPLAWHTTRQSTEAKAVSEKAAANAINQACGDDDDARGHAHKRNAGRARFECV